MDPLLQGVSELQVDTGTLHLHRARRFPPPPDSPRIKSRLFPALGMRLSAESCLQMSKEAPNSQSMMITPPGNKNKRFRHVFDLHLVVELCVIWDTVKGSFRASELLAIIQS